MKKSILTFSLAFSILTIWAQVYVPGSHNDWDLDSGNEALMKSGLGGAQTFYGITIQPSLDGDFKIVLNTWATNWGAGYWITLYNQKWTIGYDGNNAFWKGTPNTYVHLCIEDPNDYIGVNLPVGIMTLSASPVDISSVSHIGFSDGLNYFATVSNQNVSIVTSGSKSPEENIYLRYSTDGWASDNFVLASGSGTSYTATIPTQIVGTTVSYYVLTSTLTWSSGNDLDSNPDLCTIHYYNNAGNNYSYTVSDPRSAQDGVWSNTSTWLFGVVPGNTENVNILATHDVIINGSVITNNLTINSGATLSIESRKSLTVNGTLTNSAGNSGILIKSDAIGTGSLIEHNGVSATVQRYLSQNKWHYVSSPVDNPLAGVFMGMYLKYWNEPAGVWTYITNPNQALSTDMMGYALWTNNNGTATFTGALNAGEKTINVTSQGTGPTYDGYNLVGNPFPSAVDWNVDDGNGWTRTAGNVLPTLWIWNGSIGQGNYGVYLKGDPGIGINGVNNIIPPHQGFFVHCTAPTGYISVNDGARIHNTKEILKSTEISGLKMIRLKAEGNGYSDEIVLHILPESTVNYESDVDAPKLIGIQEAPQLYSLSKDGMNLSINAFPETEDYSDIPIGFEAGENEIYSITVAQKIGFDTSETIYLEDKLENTFTKLTGENVTYTFAGGPANDPMRFVIHFNSEMAVPDNTSGNDLVKVYSFGNSITLIGSEPLEGKVRIYDLPGQLIAEANLNSEIQKEINLEGHQGYMIVSVITQQNIVTKKILIH